MLDLGVFHSVSSFSRHISIWGPGLYRALVDIYSMYVVVKTYSPMSTSEQVVIGCGIHVLYVYLYMSM